MCCMTESHFRFALWSCITGVVKSHSSCALIQGVLFELPLKYFTYLICFYSIVLLLNTPTVHILQVFSIYSSPLHIREMPISNFTTCMKQNVTSTLWTWQCATIAITPCNLDTPPPPHSFSIKSCCLCFYSLPFSFIFSLSSCCLLDSFIQSPAEIQL